MLEFHPLANLFPLIEGRDFDELVADVRANGLQQPIVLFEDKILDGRNRYRAAVEADLFVEDVYWQGSLHFVRFGYTGPTGPFREATIEAGPLAYVLSLNLHRRHLNESQRAMIASTLATMKVGRPGEWRGDGKSSNLSNLSNVKQDDAADLLHVSRSSVQTAGRVQERGAQELVDAVNRGEVKVSAAAEVAKLPVSEQLEILRSVPPRLLAQVAKERANKPSGERSVMASRREPSDSLDYFPTPPWATRALIEDVLGIGQLTGMSVLEPACGEGHISGVLDEYGIDVHASDIFDYSTLAGSGPGQPQEGRSPPGWVGVADFLDHEQHFKKVDWVITNAPFAGDSGDRTLEFALRALTVAKKGVALFVRQQWLEGVERYTRLFSDRRPDTYAQFVERVNLCKGRWEPEGSTASAYGWLIWRIGKTPHALTTLRWIPPGRRVERSLPDDVERFTAHPVLKFGIPAGSRADVDRQPAKASASADQPRLGEGPEETTDEGLSKPGAVASAPEPASLATGPESGESAVLPADLTLEQQNDIIRAGYARTPVASIAELMAATGLKRSTVKMRAVRMNLSDPENQKAAARRVMSARNAGRVGAAHG